MFRVLFALSGLFAVMLGVSLQAWHGDEMAWRRHAGQQAGDSTTPGTAGMGVPGPVRVVSLLCLPLVERDSGMGGTGRALRG